MQPGTVPTPEQVARRYYDLFNRRLLDEAALLVNSHAVFLYPHTKEHLIGRAGYRELTRMWLTAFPDGRIEIESLHVDAGHIVRVELLGRGTHTGPLAFGGPLSLAPTGRNAELPLTEALDIHDGQIVDAWLRFDVQEMLRRLR